MPSAFPSVHGIRTMELVQEPHVFNKVVIQRARSVYEVSSYFQTTSDSMYTKINSKLHLQENFSQMILLLEPPTQHTQTHPHILTLLSAPFLPLQMKYSNQPTPHKGIAYKKKSVYFQLCIYGQNILSNVRITLWSFRETISCLEDSFSQVKLKSGFYMSFERQCCADNTISIKQGKKKIKYKNIAQPKSLK